MNTNNFKKRRLNDDESNDSNELNNCSNPQLINLQTNEVSQSQPKRELIPENAKNQILSLYYLHNKIWVSVLNDSNFIKLKQDYNLNDFQVNDFIKNSVSSTKPKIKTLINNKMKDFTINETYFKSELMKIYNVRNLSEIPENGKQLLNVFIKINNSHLDFLKSSELARLSKHESFADSEYIFENIVNSPNDIDRIVNKRKNNKGSNNESSPANANTNLSPLNSDSTLNNSNNELVLNNSNITPNTDPILIISNINSDTDSELSEDLSEDTSNSLKRKRYRNIPEDDFKQFRKLLNDYNEEVKFTIKLKDELDEKKIELKSKEIELKLSNEKFNLLEKEHEALKENFKLLIQNINFKI